MISVALPLYVVQVDFPAPLCRARRTYVRIRIRARIRIRTRLFTVIVWSFPTSWAQLLRFERVINT